MSLTERQIFTVHLKREQKVAVRVSCFTEQEAMALGFEAAKGTATDVPVDPDEDGPWCLDTVAGGVKPLEGRK